MKKSEKQLGTRGNSQGDESVGKICHSRTWNAYFQIPSNNHGTTYSPIFLYKHKDHPSSPSPQSINQSISLSLPLSLSQWRGVHVFFRQCCCWCCFSWLVVLLFPSLLDIYDCLCFLLMFHLHRYL